MDAVEFAEKYNSRPQRLMDSIDAQNQQGMENVLKGAQIFGGQAIERQKIASNQQLTMAQMAQNQTQFTALQGLREQELVMNQSKTMADIGLMDAHMQGQTLQNQQLTLQAQQAPLKLENQAYLNQNMSQVLDPEKGPENAVKLWSGLPHPEAASDVDRQSFFANSDLARSHSALNLAFTNNLANQTKQIAEAADLGLHMQNYLKDPNISSPTQLANPANYDMDRLNGDAYQAKVMAMNAKIKMQQEGAIKVAELRAASGMSRAQLGALNKKAIADANNATRLSDPMKTFSAEGKAALKAAQEEAAKSQSAFDAALAGENPGTTMPENPTMQNPGQVAPTGNPAQSWWQTNMTPVNNDPGP